MSFGLSLAADVPRAEHDPRYGQPWLTSLPSSPSGAGRAGAKWGAKQLWRVLSHYSYIVLKSHCFYIGGFHVDAGARCPWPHDGMGLWGSLGFGREPTCLDLSLHDEVT